MLYQSYHTWLRSTYGKPVKCENCGLEGRSIKRKIRRIWNIQYALKRGKEHAKNRNNYLSLCRKCHEEYDMPDYSTREMKIISILAISDIRMHFLDIYKTILLGKTIIITRLGERFAMLVPVKGYVVLKEKEYQKLKDVYDKQIHD